MTTRLWYMSVIVYCKLMAVLDRNPHHLSYLITTPGYEDDNGDYHEGGSHWDGCVPCDAVPSGKAEEKEFEDGVTRRYSYTVHLPGDCRTFTIGDRVKISLLGGVEREFDVKGFHRLQLQCKMWV